MTKIPSDDILESLYTLRRRESEQLKTVSELYDMDEKIDAQLSEIENDGEQKYRPATSIAKFCRQT